MLAPSFSQTCQNGLHKVSVKHAERYVKHGLHQISVKHARMAAACTSSRCCACFLPRWVKASQAIGESQFCHQATRGRCRQVPRATQHEVRCCQVPRLPRKVPRRHGRLTAPKRAIRSNPVSLSATPATQSAAAAQATNGAQVRHQIQSSVQPSVISATPAIKTKVDVSKCHAKCRGATGD